MRCINRSALNLNALRYPVPSAVGVKSRRSSVREFKVEQFGSLKLRHLARNAERLAGKLVIPDCQSLSVGLKFFQKAALIANSSASPIVPSC